jgi:regulator of sirC expression with transglutaminase-like and TPR domain
LMRAPQEQLPLDEAALIIAAHANPELDVGNQLRRLDRIAAQVSEASTSAVCHVLFQRLGLRGDRRHYDDPRNSFIDQVLDRRRGIPISLSVLLIEIGRRCGLHLDGVGMPGHFLVRDSGSPQLLIDAFDGGQRLDRSACEQLLRRVTGTSSELTPGMLAATAPPAIIARMLANLDRSFERRADGKSLLWVSTLRLALPGLPLGDRMQLAVRLGSLGRFDDAANLLDELADHEPTEELTARLKGEATTMRARLN